MRLYSKTTGCTYILGMHVDIPQDAQEISEAVFLSVIANPLAGKIRSHDASGLPILIDLPSATNEELAAAERKWRDGQVSATEWLVTRHRDEQDMQVPTTLTADQFAQLLSYRQELRDWPLALDFPHQTGRPKELSWLSSQIQ
ncbi:phage tail protein [Pseudomonas ogarae]|uniref:phage tail assembly chaperone n=1 Tax=Pseudomonas ogarae (strain DSM 112162 / CECT 30235 / F113) TaxID=1114970 RepID=UPI0009A3DA98|nr:phage tail assembly chaperone [Pseudomonas ogarae]OPG73067.1 phage tail protein [Pseudomonas ogarae]